MALLAQRERVATVGVPVYEYEYELDSTRGRKRVLNSVAVQGGKLFILNAVVKCGKEQGQCNEDAVAELRAIASTFELV